LGLQVVQGHGIVVEDVLLSPLYSTSESVRPTILAEMSYVATIVAIINQETLPWRNSFMFGT
jgi:hypothetical protein